ncbi:MAG: thymidylate kinase [Acidobacteriota bacterium]
MQESTTISGPLLVSFSGVDGAGKSTQIAALKTRLEQEGLRVRITTFWDNIACLTGVREGAGHHVFKGEKGVGSPEKPVNRRDKNVQSWPMSCVRLCLYLLDAFATRAAVRQARQSTQEDVVIFDRYIYDELANLNLRNPLIRLYVRILMKLVPRPEVSYLLDANPVEARLRKPEYPLDFIYQNRQAYRSLAALIGGIAIVAPGPLEAVRREVLRHAFTALALFRPVPESSGHVLQRAS